MPTATPYFLYPWSTAASDDVTIPATGASSGTLSYQYGFTPNYEYDLLTNPSALPIPRTYTNQLFFDITSALNQLQTYGVPAWVSVAGGGPASGYPLNAIVIYSDGNIYQSQVATNTHTPTLGTSTYWVQISGQGTLTSSVVTGASPVTGLTNGTAANITSLVVPAGNWNIFANGGNTFTGSFTQGFFWLATTNSLTPPDTVYTISVDGATDAGGGEIALVLPFLNINSASPTTVYLNTLPRFSSGSCSAYGQIQAQGV